MKKLIFILGSSLAALSTTGCSINRISLNKTYISLGMGDTTKLIASVSGPSQNVTWTTENANIATVDENGVVTPVSRGTTKIFATANGKSVKCDVKVRMKAILLGVDGAGDFFFDVPNKDPFQSIFLNNHSAITVKKGNLTANPTISAECWGSMLTGVSPRVHGFTNDGIKVTPNTKHPSIFKEAYNQIPDVKLASIVNWTPINTGIVEDGLGVDKIAHKGESDLDVKNEVVNYLTNNSPDLLYVQFDSVDHAGHEHGYRTEAYLNQLQTVEGYIVEIYKTLKETNKIQNYDFIVTADHGGLGKKHGGWSDDEKYTFFGITGSNIKDNRQNSCEVIQGMNVIDNTAILAHCLGIENNPEWGNGIKGGVKVPDNIFID